MINYYEYDTSPRKLEPEYEERKIEKRHNTKRKQRNEELVNSRKKAKYIVNIGLVFIILLTVSYRYSLINTKFNEKEKLKSELAKIHKENAQLQINIEKGTNINNVEQQAKEKLGMKKLDNNQKIYVSLPKEDYVESAIEEVETAEDETWWQALIRDLFGR